MRAADRDDAVELHLAVGRYGDAVGAGQGAAASNAPFRTDQFVRTHAGVEQRPEA